MECPLFWTGWTDVNLTEQGRTDAQHAGEAIKNIHFDQAFTSKLKRAQQTLEEIKKVINQENLPTTQAQELNERDYGDLTGKNKWKIKEEYGEEQFAKWRRGWDEPIPNGESLRDVYNRVLPYYQTNILPLLKEGKNVIIAAHGNSLRALVKELDKLSNEEISKLEFGIGEAYVYQIDENGNVVDKEIRAKNENAGKI